MEKITLFQFGLSARWKSAFYSTNKENVLQFKIRQKVLKL